MSEVAENQLVKRVFSNPAGIELLEMWNKIYIQRISHSHDNTSEHTAYREGERAFLLSIGYLLDFKEPK